MASVLNENASVVIGNYLFKLNFETEEVYAIPTNEDSRLLSLVERGSMLSSYLANARMSEKIKVFSFEDDVFVKLAVPDPICPDCVPLCDDCIDVQVISTSACDEPKAPRGRNRSVAGCSTGFVTINSIPIETNIQAQVEVRYRRLGIIFRLFSQITVIEQDLQGPTIINEPFEVLMPFTATWKPRCRNTLAQTRVFRGFVPRHKEVLYSGWRQLSEYDLTASGCFESPDCINTGGACTGEVNISFP